MNVKKFGFLMVVLTFSQGAAADLPYPLDVTEQRNAAAGFAIKQADVVEMAGKACSAVPEVAAQFAEAERQWVGRNGPYVDAADAWVTWVKVLRAKQDGDAAAKDFYVHTYELLSDNAAKLVAKLLPGSPPSATDCRRLKDMLDSRQADLDQEAEFARDLRDMRTFYDAVSAWGKH